MLKISQDQTTVLIWSDNDFLYDIIATNLNGLRLRVKRAGPEETVQDLSVILLIIALSSCGNEPEVTPRSQAPLTYQNNRVPLLVISDQPFKADSTNQIYHLDFPFSAAQLHHIVQSLLSEQTSKFSGNPNQQKDF